MAVVAEPGDASLFEDKGAFLAQGLLKVEVRARDPAMKGLPGICGCYGLERSIGGPLGGMLSGEERQFGGGDGKCPTLF